MKTSVIEVRDMFKLIARDEYWQRREKVWMSLHHGVRQTAHVQGDFERAAQRPLVQADAVAHAVQRFDRRCRLATIVAA